MARIILLSSDVLDKMIADKAFQQFPCIAAPPRKAVKAYKKIRSSGCGGCRKTKKDVKVRARAHKPGPVDYNALKIQIVELPSEAREAIKRLLECTGLKVQYRNRKGSMERRVL
jgi:hypothetical protein